MTAKIDVTVEVDDRKRENSIWHTDMTWQEIEDLSPREKNRRFPNDFNPNGEPYGDF